jgi:hypothetical protein
MEQDVTDPKRPAPPPEDDTEASWLISQREMDDQERETGLGADFDEHGAPF